MKQSPSDVRDIGVLGGDIAPFLYRLRAEHPKHFAAVVRTLRNAIAGAADGDTDSQAIGRVRAVTPRLRDAAVAFGARERLPLDTQLGARWKVLPK